MSSSNFSHSEGGSGKVADATENSTTHSGKGSLGNQPKNSITHSSRGSLGNEADATGNSITHSSRGSLGRVADNTKNSITHSSKGSLGNGADATGNSITPSSKGSSTDNMPLAPLTATPPAHPQKSSPRIEFRGKLDSLNAQIVFLQTLSQNHEYISDLEELRQIIRRLQACEAGEKIFAESFTLWGLSEDEIHHRSHNPAKFFGRGHILPHHDMQTESAGLNLLRTQIRETELSACLAFEESDYLRLCHVLNRLSSAAYILTYKYLPEEYNHVLIFHTERRNATNEQIQV